MAETLPNFILQLKADYLGSQTLARFIKEIHKNSMSTLFISEMQKPIAVNVYVITELHTSYITIFLKIKHFWHSISKIP